MFKVLLGAGLVVVLVGYGVLTPQTLEEAEREPKQASTMRRRGLRIILIHPILTKQRIL